MAVTELLSKVLRAKWAGMLLVGIPVACGLASGGSGNTVRETDGGAGGDSGSEAVPDFGGAFFEEGILSEEEQTSAEDLLGDNCGANAVEPLPAKVDIVFVIDNSHSMADEIEKVQREVGDFAHTIGDAALDYRVIFLGAKGTGHPEPGEESDDLKGSGLSGDVPYDVCVPPPLAGPDCADNPPIFHHLDNFPYGIQSHNTMFLAMSMYNRHYTWDEDSAISGPEGGGWSQWARRDALKYFVVVSDDDADLGDLADEAIPGEDTDDPSLELHQRIDWLLMTSDRYDDPRGGFGVMDGDCTTDLYRDSESEGCTVTRNYVYNAIVGKVLDERTDVEWPEGVLWTGCTTSPSADERNDAVSEGLQHQALAELTGGNVESICEDDWHSIFDRLATGVTNRLGCEFTVPGDAGDVRADFVNVIYRDEVGAEGRFIRRADGARDCGSDEAWYFEDPEHPETVRLCERACAGIGAQSSGRIDVLLECPYEEPR